MFYSMTGFGMKTIEIEDVKINIEIRSLNSKQLDINLKTPLFLREYEHKIRKFLSEKLRRGKIDIFFQISNNNQKHKNLQLDKAILSSILEQVQDLYKELGINVNNQKILSTLLTQQFAVKEFEIESNENLWEDLRKGLILATEELVNFRKQEGKIIYEKVISYVENINANLTQIQPLEELRIGKIKNRIKEHFADSNLSIDENRFEKELVYYLEKLDISEEITRLNNHCNYFLVNCNNQVITKGKKLGFIAQEIGREINTLSVKAQNAEIQIKAVEMKDQLEKIKEQLFNVL